MPARPSYLDLGGDCFLPHWVAIVHGQCLAVCTVCTRDFVQDDFAFVVWQSRRVAQLGYDPVTVVGFKTLREARSVWAGKVGAFAAQILPRLPDENPNNNNAITVVS